MSTPPGHCYLCNKDISSGGGETRRISNSYVDLVQNLLHII